MGWALLGASSLLIGAALAFVAPITKHVLGFVLAFAFGYVADATGDWRLPFVGSLGLLLLGAVLAPLMHPERAFVEVVATGPSMPAAVSPEMR